MQPLTQIYFRPLHPNFKVTDMKFTCQSLAVSLLLVMTSCNKEISTEREPVSVKTIQMTDAGVASMLFSGTVEEESGVILSFQIPGTVDRLPVNVGQRISAGQLVASVNPTAVQNAYDAARATLMQAQDAYDRMKQLHDRGSIPEIQWVEVQSKLSQASASEQIAKKNLQDCRLTAPFSGIIISKDMEVGQSAMPGQPVVKLARIGKVKVNVAVPESEIGSIRSGDMAEIEVPALNGNFSGVVTEIGIAANPVSHTYDVKILVDNPTGKLMPGMIAKVEFDDSNRLITVKTLPGRCIGIDECNRKFVWVVENSKAHRRYVECGRPFDDGVEILSGLSKQDSIIIEGQQKVSENMVVQVIR